MMLNEFKKDIQNKIKRLLKQGDFKEAKAIYDEQKSLLFLKERQHKHEPLNDSTQTSG